MATVTMRSACQARSIGRIGSPVGMHHPQPRIGPTIGSRLVATRAAEQEGHELHPEADHVDEETMQFNTSHLGALAARIAQIRQAQALHMLQHRYTPTQLNEIVEDSLTSRPDLEFGAGLNFAQLDDWHAAQWAKMKDTMEAAPERSV